MSYWHQSEKPLFLADFQITFNNSRYFVLMAIEIIRTNAKISQSLDKLIEITYKN